MGYKVRIRNSYWIIGLLVNDENHCEASEMKNASVSAGLWRPWQSPRINNTFYKPTTRNQHAGIFSFVFRFWSKAVSKTILPSIPLH